LQVIFFNVSPGKEKSTTVELLDVDPSQKSATTATAVYAVWDQPVAPGNIPGVSPVIDLTGSSLKAPGSGSYVLSPLPQATPEYVKKQFAHTADEIQETADKIWFTPAEREQLANMAAARQYVRVLTWVVQPISPIGRQKVIFRSPFSGLIKESYVQCANIGNNKAIIKFYRKAIGTALTDTSESPDLNVDSVLTWPEIPNVALALEPGKLFSSVVASASTTPETPDILVVQRGDLIDISVDFVDGEGIEQPGPYVSSKEAITVELCILV
jgi:hypothetical protein